MQWIKALLCRSVEPFFGYITEVLIERGYRPKLCGNSVVSEKNGLMKPRNVHPSPYSPTMSREGGVVNLHELFMWISFCQNIPKNPREFWGFWKKGD